ncbi:two-component system regulatory protein YycI [Brevibacillus borstelensis]|uniref:Regulatory protein YycH-like domain-containing protein n=1 Tax=Brevibacillus borstelensis AK1 TaxID=1300222 RepID=M8DGR2_9BACL|nr:two-component system regulatory protein YycI [Brevibacillus borstelensis]EMT52658.1 hypothetical protein I532_13414 [Brevibacillus borstelensis AK1]MED1884936.1 two-component system regulatory protein YycI [Brevibacillus borstelensis]RNB65017.1 hypothetical protein EDM54_04785 [Brevibacillus borstelensis]GED55283.1 two-component system WalR/WalK regulatory protein YycI [Brevibacillus borstelensis]
MDWSKTKTILIWAFLLLDVFLGYQVYATRGGYWQNPEASQSEKWEMDDYLRQHNVTLDAEVPSDTPDMTYLNAEYVGIGALELQGMAGIDATLEKMALAARLKPPIAINGQITPNELLRQIGPRMMYSDQYTADLYQSNQGRLLYWQVYDKVPIFIAPLEVYLADGSILGYRQTYLNIRSQGTSRPIISAYKAIRSLVEKQVIHPGERIENVTLGYYGSYDAEIQGLAPVWRIIHDGKQHFVNGFTGAQERPLVTNYFPGK